MSGKATWSTRATPLAGVAEGVVLTLGIFSLVLGAIFMARGQLAWHPAASAVLLLAAILVVLRLWRSRLTPSLSLCWCTESHAFHLSGSAGALLLERVWLGPAWVTLGLRPAAGHGPPLHVVIWKSANPAPSWSELVLRLETGLQRKKSHQNKENP